MRSGAQALALLATPLNFLILDALVDGPRSQVTLRRETGSPAQTTIRAPLRKLAGVGAISNSQRNRFPGTHSYELTDAGHELRSVAAVLERWLDDAPKGSLSLGTSDAKTAVGALADGWSTALLRAIAARPLTLTELNNVIGCLNYPALQRRLGAMRTTGQVETQPCNGRGSLNRVTEWLRRGIAPIAAAARWERRRLPEDTVPLTALDTEAILLLTVPLLRLPSELSGYCRLAAELPSNSGSWKWAGVVVRVEDGVIVSCTTRMEGTPEAWALGSPNGWLNAVIDDELDKLELGGDCDLARAVLDGLHRALFGDQAALQSV